MMIRIFILIAVLVPVLYSCADTTNNQLIVGNWQASEWLINGQPSEENARNTSFSFTADHHYTFVNSGVQESGTYKVENDMLFTTATGQQEMMVRIAKLTNDSLVFNMNRGGQAETLTLTRTK